MRFIELPDTTTQFGQFIIHSMDEYGNMGSDMSDAYNSEWREKIKKVASRKNIKLHEGIYLGSKGPSF